VVFIDYFAAVAAGLMGPEAIFDSSTFALLTAGLL
jgi:hypothetical protein